MSRQFRLCFKVARSKRGSHSNGDETQRPSAKVTTIESFVNLTSTASATDLAVKALIPGSDEFISVFCNHSAKCRQLVTPKVSRLRQLTRLQPELRVFLRVLHMNVPGFIAFTTEEEESATPRPQHFWHARTLAHSRRRDRPECALLLAPRAPQPVETPARNATDASEYPTPLDAVCGCWVERFVQWLVQPGKASALRTKLSGPR